MADRGKNKWLLRNKLRGKHTSIEKALEKLSGMSFQRLEGFESIRQLGRLTESDGRITTGRVADDAFDLTEQSSFSGNGVYWGVIPVPMTAAQDAGAFQPTFEQYKDDGGGSTGVYVNSFQSAGTNTLGFSVIVPPNYKEGTDIIFKAHWAPSVTAIATANVTLGLEYNWANVDGTFGNTTDDNVVVDVNGIAADTHILTTVETITGTNIDILANINGRFYRKNSTANEYGQKVWIFAAGFYYQIDRVGSAQAESKD